LIEMGSRPSIFAWLRRHRRGGITLFVLLLLVVAAERRLAEYHLTPRSAAHALESNDTLDGDEVRVRLVVLNDDKPPTLPAASGTFAPHRPHVAFPFPPALALGRPAPRGPPAPSVSPA
jgi:hypothetical protein